MIMKTNTSVAPAAAPMTAKVIERQGTKNKNIFLKSSSSNRLVLIMVPGF